MSIEMVNQKKTGATKESVADRMRRQARAFRAGKPMSGEQFPQVVRGSMHAEPDDLLVSQVCADAMKHAELASLRGKYEARTVTKISFAIERAILEYLVQADVGFSVRIERDMDSVVIYIAWPEPGSRTT
jgi:hypothetical protein